MNSEKFTYQEESYTNEKFLQIPKKDDEQFLRLNEEGMKVNGKSNQQGAISNTDRISNFMKSIKWDEAEKNRTQQKHQYSDFNPGIKRLLDDLTLDNNSKRNRLQTLLFQLQSNYYTTMSSQQQKRILTTLHEVIENDGENDMGKEDEDEPEEEDSSNEEYQTEHEKFNELKSNRNSNAFSVQNETQTSCLQSAAGQSRQKSKLQGCWSNFSSFKEDQHSEIEKNLHHRLEQMKHILCQKKIKQEEVKYEFESLLFLQKRTKNYITDFQKKLIDIQLIKQTIEKTSESMHSELNGVSMETKLIHVKQDRIKERINEKDKNYFEALSGKEIVQLENEKDLFEMMKQFETESQKLNSMKATLKSQEKQIAILEKQQKHKHRMQDQQNSNAELIDRINELISIHEFCKKIDNQQEKVNKSSSEKIRKGNDINNSESKENTQEDLIESLEDALLEVPEDDKWQRNRASTHVHNFQKRNTITIANSKLKSKFSFEESSKGELKLSDKSISSQVFQKRQSLFQGADKFGPSARKIPKKLTIKHTVKRRDTTSITGDISYNNNQDNSHTAPDKPNTKIIQFLESIKENISGFFDNLVSRHKNLQTHLDDLQIEQTMLRELRNDRLKELNELMAVPIDKTEVQLFQKKKNENMSIDADSAETKLRCEFIDETQLDDVKQYKEQLLAHQKMNVDEMYIFERNQEFYSLNKVQVIILFTQQNLKNIHYRMVRAIGSLGDHSYLTVYSQISELVNRGNTALKLLNERTKALFERDYDKLKSEISSSILISQNLDETQQKAILDIIIEDQNIFKSISSLLKYFIPFAQNSIKDFVEEFKFGYHLLRFCRKSDLIEFSLRVAQEVVKKLCNNVTADQSINNYKCQIPIIQYGVGQEEADKIVFLCLMENFQMLVEKSISSILSIIMERVMMIVQMTKTITQLMQSITANPISGDPSTQIKPETPKGQKQSSKRYLDFNYGQSVKQKVYSPFLPLSKYSKYQIQKLNSQKGVTKYETLDSLLTINSRDLVIKKNPILMNISEIVKEQICMLHYQNSPSIVNLVEEYCNFDDLRNNVKSELKSIQIAARKKKDKERIHQEGKKKLKGKKNKRLSQVEHSSSSESVQLDEVENISTLSGTKSNEIIKEMINNPLSNVSINFPNLAKQQVIDLPQNNYSNHLDEIGQEMISQVPGTDSKVGSSHQIPSSSQDTDLKNESSSGLKSNQKLKMIVNLTKAFKMWNFKGEEDQQLQTNIKNEESGVDKVDETNEKQIVEVKIEKQREKRKIKEPDPQKTEFIEQLKKIVHYQMDYKNEKKKGIDQHFVELNSLRNANKTIDQSSRPMTSTAGGLISNGANKQTQDDYQYQDKLQQNNFIQSPPQTAPVVGTGLLTQGLAKAVQGEKTKIKKAFVGYFRRKQYEQYKELELKLGTLFKHSDKFYFQNKQYNQTNQVTEDLKIIEFKVDNQVLIQNGSGGELLPDIIRKSSGNVCTNNLNNIPKMQVNGILLNSSNSDEEISSFSIRHKSASPRNNQNTINKNRISIQDKNEEIPLRSFRHQGDIKIIKFPNPKQSNEQKSSSKSPEKKKISTIKTNERILLSKASRSPSPISFNRPLNFDDKRLFPLIQLNQPKNPLNNNGSYSKHLKEQQNQIDALDLPS